MPSATELAASVTDGLIVVVTGAGISAESGIPTYRGEEGYWVVGAREYRAEEMATHAAFGRFPHEVWRWYLYRRAVCRAADANGGHLALTELEAALGDDFLLATQNVDGLHLRAGQSQERTYEVHGNIDFMRCANACSAELYPLPTSAPLLAKDDPLTEEAFESLRCPECDAPARPHVLWFDECYDEELYRFESSLAASARASMLITIGTSGATNLPTQMVRLAARRGIPIIDINPGDNPFGQVAEQSGGAQVALGAGEGLPPIVSALISARGGSGSA